jgi:hypothetical protein
MEFRINKSFDRERMLADLRVVYGDSLANARSFGIAAVGVGVGGAVLQLLLWEMNGLLLLLLGLAAFGLYVSYGAVRSLRQAVDDLPKACRQDSVIVVTDERISQEFPGIRSEIAWTVITRAVETDTGWLLFYGSQQAISVPVNSLTEVERSQFRDFVDVRNPRGQVRATA